MVDDIQIDPTFKSERCYVKITAKCVYKRLLNKPCYSEASFCERTLNNVLNRFGHTLKKVLKAKPLRKIPETDAIFENVANRHQEAQKDSRILRISIDSKAKVKVGNLSRGGYSRMQLAPRAADHDQQWDATLVPLGVYELNTEQVTMFFGNSLETSDFIVDGLQMWWHLRGAELDHYEKIMIDLDNGKALAGNTKRFIKRMVAFAKRINKPIHLVYYPPYHSKYNAIERVWAALENYWRGLVLDTVPNTLKIAAQMTWKNNQPIIQFIDKVYHKGLPVPTKDELKELQQYIRRHPKLKKWDILISPIPF